MAKNQRTETQAVIDIAFSIGAVQVGAFAFFKKNRCATQIFKGTNRRMYAAWNYFFCSFKKKVRKFVRQNFSNRFRYNKV